MTSTTITTINLNEYVVGCDAVADTMRSPHNNRYKEYKGNLNVTN
jgi:hypothetical protein